LPTPASSALTRRAAGSPARRHAAHRRGSGLPPLLLVPAALALAFLVLPLLALLLRAPWQSLPERLLSPGVGAALRSRSCAPGSATLVCLVLGVPLAWVLARASFPGRRLVRALVTVPLVLPPVVGGVALLLLLGRRGVSASTSTAGSASRCRSPPPR
jgi:molybdate transport system permease protein